MKNYTYSLLAAALACGISQAAETAYTTPVGYENLQINPGLNFCGVRMHETPIAAGKLESFATGPNRVTDNDLDLGALIVSGTYVLEIEDGSGIIQEVTSATGTALNVAADLSSLTYPVSYKLRPAATMASVFGTAFTSGAPGHLDKSGLTIGSFGAAGADQVWFWNGVDFEKYYFDEFTEASGFSSAGWVNLANTAATVDPSTVNMIYADGFVISSDAGVDVTISGEVKKGSTEFNLLGGALNFVSSVAPAGATLESAFGTTFASGFLDSGLAIGSFGSAGADQVWLWNGTDFDQYYFDEFTEASGFSAPGWVKLSDTSLTITPSSISLDSGYIISAAGSKAVQQGVPVGYSSL